MVVALIAGPYYLMGSGPQWPGMKFGQDTCRNYWWKTLLYINNLYDTNDMVRYHVIITQFPKLGEDPK